ncbi:MAG: TIGR03000 domain-containing protein [Planctomycetes bacterium]|nr:TIGR03000 domain-containing protein [Planctomycetota bacterium]
MMHRRLVFAILATGIVCGALSMPQAQAFPRRAIVMSGPGITYYYPGATYYPGVWNSYYYNPYVLPAPYYGILPPAFATQDGSMFRTAQEPYDPTIPTPRKRPGLYPAVPYEKSPEERLADLRRVRFEITVPYADAVVTFNGNAKKQTGLTRIFATPPLKEGEEYTITVNARWRKQDGAMSAPREKAFKVRAGDSVQHTFVEQ